MSRDGKEFLRLFYLIKRTELPVNTAVAALTRSGIMGMVCRGPILIMRYDGENEPPIGTPYAVAVDGGMAHYKNIDMRDVRNVADFFSSVRLGTSDTSVKLVACSILCNSKNELLQASKNTTRWKYKQMSAPMDEWIVALQMC